MLTAHVAISYQPYRTSLVDQVSSLQSQALSVPRSLSNTEWLSATPKVHMAETVAIDMVPIVEMAVNKFVVSVCLLGLRSASGCVAYLPCVPQISVDHSDRARHPREKGTIPRRCSHVTTSRSTVYSSPRPQSPQRRTRNHGSSW